MNKVGGTIGTFSSTTEALDYFLNNVSLDAVETFSAGASNCVVLKLSIPNDKQTPYFSLRTSNFGTPIRSVLIKATVTIDEDFHQSFKSKMNYKDFNVATLFDCVSVIHEDVISREVSTQKHIIKESLRDETSDIDPPCPYIYGTRKSYFDENQGEINNYEKIVQLILAKMVNEDMIEIGYDDLNKLINSLVKEDNLRHIYLNIIFMEFLEGLQDFNSEYTLGLYPYAYKNNFCQTLNYCTAMNMSMLEFINLARCGCFHLDYHKGNMFVDKYTTNYFNNLNGRIVPIDFGRAVLLNEADVKSINDLYQSGNLAETINLMTTIYDNITKATSNYCSNANEKIGAEEFNKTLCQSVNEKLFLSYLSEIDRIRENPEEVIKSKLKQMNIGPPSRMAFKDIVSLPANKKFTNLVEEFILANKGKVFIDCETLVNQFFDKFDKQYEDIITLLPEEKDMYLQTVINYSTKTQKGYEEEEEKYNITASALSSSKITTDLKKRVSDGLYDHEVDKVKSLYDSKPPDDNVVSIETLSTKRQEQVAQHKRQFNDTCLSVGLSETFDDFKSAILVNETESEVFECTFMNKYLGVLKKYNPTFEDDVHVVCERRTFDGGKVRKTRKKKQIKSKKARKSRKYYRK